jgi:23S rRNA pseudouridine2605 synthase
MKLQLFIAHNGGVSRRKAFDHVLAGDVTVNGMVVREPSHMIEPTEDKVALFASEIKPRAYEYVMLNKPAGYVTTCEAQRDQRAVMELLPPQLQHLKPVGRLDKDTEGLLLLTNDGELANRLAHPSFDVNKTYRVRVERRMALREKDRLQNGVVIEKFRTAPAEIDNMHFEAGFTEFDLTIHEGHKRQVRLMCHEVGHDVLRLIRIAQGPLKLDDLKSRTWRALTAEEVDQLRVIGRAPGRAVRANPFALKPVFQSKFSGRGDAQNRDWHSGQPSKPADPRPRNAQGERMGPPPLVPKVNFGFRGPGSERGERKEYKPFNRGASARDDRPRTERPAGDRSREDRPGDGRSTRREFRPADRDARSREQRPGADRSRSDRPRTDRPAGERKEYKPFNRDPRGRDDRPRTDRPAGASSSKPYQKPFGKKPFGRSSAAKPYGRPSSGPKTFSRPQR